MTRDQAFEEFDKTGESNSPVFDPGAARRAFNAGWNARKQLDYEAALGIKRPLHSSAYEPLTPFKPHPHNSTEEAIVARIKETP